MSAFIKKFNEISSADIASVGTKNVSLADLYHVISSENQNGFAITSQAFRFFLKYNRIEDLLKELMDSVDRKTFGNLKEIAWWARRIIITAQLPADLENEIKTAFKEFSNDDAVALRSSVICEELPNETFIGQHQTYPNIDTEEKLLIAIKNCFASLYTDKAIRYREENGIADHKVSISIGIQRMPVSKQVKRAIFNFDEAVA